jgi:signal transduction histidine kinase
VPASVRGRWRRARPPRTAAGEAYLSWLRGAPPAVLGYHLVALLAPSAALVARDGFGRLAPVAPATLVFATTNALALALLVCRPAVGRSAVRALLPIDLLAGIAAGVMVSAVRPDSLARTYQKVFLHYAIGSAVLLTVAWGVVVGLCAVAAALPAQLAMDSLARARGGPTGVYHALGLIVWLAAAVALTSVAMAWTGLVARQAHTRGALRERARLHRLLHDTVLQSLDAISLSSSLDQRAAPLALAEVRALAHREAVRLRRALDASIDQPAVGGSGYGPDDHAPGDLAAALHRVVDEIRPRLRVELVMADLDRIDATRGRCEALCGAVRAALDNAARHSGARHAVVRVEAAGDGVRVVVRDHGTGLPAEPGRFGIRESILGRIRDVGGTARVEGSPGGGTRVTMWVPAW